MRKSVVMLSRCRRLRRSREIIALAAAMRAYGLEDGRDLNAANLFTHTLLEAPFDCDAF